MRKVVTYITTDGQEFSDEASAKKHEAKSTNKQADLDSVKETLSKALIQLKAPSLADHQKADSLRWEVEKFLRSATVSDEYYSSSDNC